MNAAYTAPGWVRDAEGRLRRETKPHMGRRLPGFVCFVCVSRRRVAFGRCMGEFTRGLRPVYCAVMPDHLHLLVEVVSELERPLGNAIGGFKTGCEKIYAKPGGKLFESCANGNLQMPEEERARAKARRTAFSSDCLPRVFRKSASAAS